MDTYPAFRNLIRGCLALVAIAIGVAIVLTGASWHRAESVRRTVLPDGSTVELLGTAIGQDTFSTEKKWHRTVRGYLPGPMQKWIPAATSGSCGGSSNGITVYLRVARAGISGGVPWQGYAAEDTTGFRYPRDGGYCSFGDSKGNTIYGLIVRCFPRREPEFVFRLLDQSGLALGTLHIPNPFQGPFPEWQPQPLPQTQTNGPVLLTLHGFEERVKGRWTNINATWGLQTTDPAWTHAKARGQTFLDPTGNEGPFLSPREPAWKVKTQVYRERTEDFAPSEQLVLTNVALPTSGNFVSIDQTADCAGVGIKVLVLASAGSFGLSNGVTRFMLPVSQGSSGHSISSGSKDTIETWGRPTPFLMVEAHNMQQDDELHANIFDQNGEELKVAMAGYDIGKNGARIYKPGFNPAPRTKSLSMRIFVSRPLPFEFIVRPEEVRNKVIVP